MAVKPLLVYLPSGLPGFSGSASTLRQWETALSRGLSRTPPAPVCYPFLGFLEFVAVAADLHAGQVLGGLAPVSDGEAFAAHKFVVGLGDDFYDEFIEDDGARELLAF